MIGKGLIGTWRIKHDDLAATVEYGDIYLEFTEDDKLIYTIYKPNGKQIINMIYKIEDGELITDQPSKPKEERTKFEITEERNLILNFEGKKSIYSKVG